MHVCFSFVKRKQRLTISRKNEEKNKEHNSNVNNNK